MREVKQGGSNMTGTYAVCLQRNQSRSYLNHLVLIYVLCCMQKYKAVNLAVRLDSFFTATPCTSKNHNNKPLPNKSAVA